MTQVATHFNASDTACPEFVVPDSPAGAWSPAFPSTELVDTAVSMFTGYRLAEREAGATLGRRPRQSEVVTDAERQSARDWMREQYNQPGFAGFRHPLMVPGAVEEDLQRALWQHRGYEPPARDLMASTVITGTETREMVEGPRFRIMVSPGVVSVRSSDPTRQDRTRERQNAATITRQNMNDVRRRAGLPIEPTGPVRVIGSWSRKSRLNMLTVLHSLDWAPLFAGTDAPPALVTLTYPGQWEHLAPNASAARRHLLMLRKRFARAWGVPLVCVWKREFQRRGAPHWHLLMVPPAGEVDGMRFREWLSWTWAVIVGAESCTMDARPEAVLEHAGPGVGCCEFHRHLAAGTGVDTAKGTASRDPRAIAHYFGKHGSYAAKDYQNEAPDLWLATGEGVGRFWGVWGLSKAVAGVLVSPGEALAAGRTLRRLSRSKTSARRCRGCAECPSMGSHLVPVEPPRVPVMRYRTKVDQDTGVVTAVWRRSTKKARMAQMRRSRGSLLVPDGPAVASAIARHLDGLYRPGSVVSRSGSGPVGFLPA